MLERTWTKRKRQLGPDRSRGKLAALQNTGGVYPACHGPVGAMLRHAAAFHWMEYKTAEPRQLGVNTHCLGLGG